MTVPLTPLSVFSVIAALVVVFGGCDPDGGGGATQPTASRSPSEPGYAPQISNEVVRAARRAGVDIHEVITTTMRKVDAVLPGPIPEVDVKADYQTDPRIGVGGFSSPYRGDITITLFPKVDDFRRTLRVWLPTTVAHEMHHSSRILAGPGYGSTLLQALVTEGLAVHFAEEMFPTVPKPPWHRPLSRREERTLWERAKHQLYDTAYNHDVWFFGAGDIPRSAGYAIGYNLVEGYLRRQHTTAREEVLAPGPQIFQVSTYDP